LELLPPGLAWDSALEPQHSDPELSPDFIGAGFWEVWLCWPCFGCWLC
jgi:hypothetical protein